MGLLTLTLGWATRSQTTYPWTNLKELTATPTYTSVFAIESFELPLANLRAGALQQQKISSH
jgi:hypothetical protein